MTTQYTIDTSKMFYKQPGGTIGSQTPQWRGRLNENNHISYLIRVFSYWEQLHASALSTVCRMAGELGE